MSALSAAAVFLSRSSSARLVTRSPASSGSGRGSHTEYVSESWIGLLGADPRRWLLEADEPAARFVALTELLDRPPDDPEASAARAAVLADHGIQALLARLPDWERPGDVSGHQSPAFAPNLLGLLADAGVRARDDSRVERLLDQMLARQEPSGRFSTFGRLNREEEPVWGALLCDTHAITEVLVRFDRGEDPRTVRALARMEADLCETAQGPAWLCVPHSVTGWRGPGRKGDACPQVTLEALRTFARLAPERRPPGLLAAARTALGVWRERAIAKPYMFGHGRAFKTVKWPTFWYDVHAVLDALGRWPELWNVDADPDDRRALSELAACLIAYNFDADGRVTPRSCYRGFDAFSFGVKTAPSPFATARLCTVLRRLDDLADEIAAVDVLTLGSSKGGSGTARPPALLRSRSRPATAPRRS